MTSKVEYLQRYMSGSGDNAADGDKKRKEKVKKTQSLVLGTHVVDVDDAWQHSAPSRGDIEKKWELEAAEDEQPMVVAEDGNEVVDIQDLPVYVDSDKYLNELQEMKKKEKSLDDGDLSPPRKREEVESCENDCSNDDASPQRRPKNEDASSLRRSSDADQSILTKKRRNDNDEDQEGILQQKRQGREQRQRSDDASPPRRPTRRKRDDDDTLPSCHERKTTALSQHVQDSVVSPSPCLSVERKVCVEDKEDALPPRRSRYMDDGSRRAEQRRRHSPFRPRAARDRQRRVDSLGRDIPFRTSRSERRPSAVTKEDSHTSSRDCNTAARSQSRSRGGVRDWDRNARASPSSRRKQRSRSRSPPAYRWDSRSTSVPRQRLPRKSTRWGSPRRDESTRGRSRSRDKHCLPSQRSLSRSHSPKRRLSRRNLVSIAKAQSNHDVDKGSCTVVESPSCNGLNAGNSTAKKYPTTKTHDEKKEKKAGLVTAAEFDHQRKVAAKQKDVLHGIDASEMGANAKTVYRDKRGRKLDMLNEMVRQQEVLDGKRKRAEREEYEWGTGEVQKQARKSQQELIEQMKKTPFARHEDDEELERKRRERVRAFDPISSKMFQEDVCKKTKKSKKDKTIRRKYAGPPAPPNRFGIIPGYRWDGVVRGANWEERIMMRQNTNAAVNEEAYKYAVADM